MVTLYLVASPLGNSAVHPAREFAILAALAVLALGSIAPAFDFFGAAKLRAIHGPTERGNLCLVPRNLHERRLDDVLQRPLRLHAHRLAAMRSSVVENQSDFLHGQPDLIYGKPGRLSSRTTGLTL